MIQSNMRVIAGERKGKRLLAPKGMKTRPTADRVKEAIFNILGPDFQQLTVLDLFSGTGAMAIEALSRGASFAAIIDHSQEAIAQIRRNIASCGFEGKSTIIRWNIIENLRCLGRIPVRFNLVFLDPPYRKGLLEPALANLIIENKLADYARVVAEHASSESLPDHFENLILEDVRTYGHTKVSFYCWLESGQQQPG
ncbi:16S rRNA (guanine(966)-N(2))-methyltransferase RsmD [Desulfatirhabdium butyrativorans]|uniref:16S rRNA (guanine(966)-N(2))-methyltransferase RsmD n=1 Tax=Desulfatirhabdium butyrativorans TaxID=340467 RepID=UPI000428C4CE|nr:16S rRNA (guanine(966)-N(2))-methyltransferase RsmD [Desulfatirhabdium butyrativorans]